jgi:hypothetical protein
VSLHLILEAQKKELEECGDFSVRRAFRTVDVLGYKFIHDANLKLFLRKMGH